MRFWRGGEKLTQKDRQELRKHAEIVGGTVKDDSLFSPFFEQVKNVKKLYKQTDLYRALDADKKFRLSNGGTLRELAEPLPWWWGNMKLRESAAYENLLKHLTEVKLMAAPEVPVKAK